MTTSPKNPLRASVSLLLRVKLFVFKLKCRNADLLYCSSNRKNDRLQQQQQQQNPFAFS